MTVSVAATAEIVMVMLIELNLLTGAGSGVGVTKLISSIPQLCYIFSKNRNNDNRLNTKIVFDRCRRSLAAVVFVRCDLDSEELSHNDANSNVFLAGNLTTRAFVTPSRAVSDRRHDRNRAQDDGKNL